MAILAKIGVFLIIIGFAIPLVAYFTFALPGNVAYQRAFGGEISITEDQPTTSGMANGLHRIWVKMNQSFGTDNHENIYSSAFYWDQTPDNSLASEDRYFRSEISRLNNYTIQYNDYVQAGTKIITGLPLTDWYDKIVNQSRNELQRNGGLDWAIQGAWLQKYQPATYWFNIYGTTFASIMVALGFLLIFLSFNKQGKIKFEA